MEDTCRHVFPAFGLYVFEQLKEKTVSSRITTFRVDDKDSSQQSFLNL